MKYQFIEKERPEFPIRVLCGVLEVSESGFYAWRKRQTGSPNRRKAEDARLTIQLEEVFEHSRQTCGSPRIYAELHSKGVSCSRRRVARLMHNKGLMSCYSRPKKRKIATTDSNHDQPVAPNRLVVILPPPLLIRNSWGI